VNILPVSVLLDQPALDHEKFSAHRELEALLKSTLRGDVLFDLGSRALYAADASNYRQMPVGVITPRDAADVEAALAACRATGAAVLPRGAGTSLAGQCANVAVVFDYSRYMRGLRSIDPAKKLAVVEPGIVLDRLREAAEVYQLTYAPDPATHSRCTLGGMIGNNSCGVHGLLGGKVVDNVERLDIMLYDGTRMNVGRTSDDEIARLIQGGGRVGQIHARLLKLRDRYASLIREKFPRIPRRVSGYNLDELLPENGFNLARALVGSEGTCATIVSATLNLAASPPHRVLTALAFEDPFLAADVVPRVLEFGPIGLEGFDGLLVDFMLRKRLAVEDVKLLGPGGGFLLVEMGAWDAAEAERKARELAATAATWPEAPRARIYSRQDAERVWKVRESALGATVAVPGEPDRWEGWDDAGVPPGELGTYLRKLNALMSEYGYRSPLYGHFGQGCVHLRINFDFRSPEGLRKFRQFIDRAADLVVSVGGSLSGEHGDGQARAVLLPKMFGPELTQAFKEFKAIWDPENRMNPGKLTDRDRVYDPVENLRYGLRGEGKDQNPPASKLKTHFAFASDQGSLEEASARCVGVGACLKTDGGVMCPSYRATGQEQHSTRGRARLLWEMLAGALRIEGLESEAVNQALDLCLSCKACKTECPVQVDMAQLKSEFLGQRYKGKLHPLHHYVFGFADKVAQIGSFAPALANFVLSNRLIAPLIKRIAGVAQERKMPRLARTSYRTSYRAARRADAAGHVPRPTPGSSPAVDPGRQRVVLWADTWNNYYHPQTLAAAERVLTQAGFDVQTTEGHICCGRALYDFGLLGNARTYLAEVFDRVSGEIDAGLPFIFLEPSCASVFKDEALELFPNHARAEKLSKQIWLLADWLAAKAPDWVEGRLTGTEVIVHGHCHHKAVFGGPRSEIQLLRKAGAHVEMIETTCCGMAGPFGFEADKIEVSRAIANLGLLPAVNGARPGTLIVADGFSCREQISQLSLREGKHFAEILDQSSEGSRTG
jgi:FAD/FMN-containing dehydrogenase/Fe-S oxidoreductase